MDYGRINKTEGPQARMKMELERAGELNLLLAYINAKIEYEFAKRGGNLFLDLNDSADALKEAERELRENY